MQLHSPARCKNVVQCGGCISIDIAPPLHHLAHPQTPPSQPTVHLHQFHQHQHTMSKPKTAKACHLPPHWKIRIHMRGGGIIHAISSTEPIANGKNLDWTPILDTEHGDTIGFIHWPDVAAIAWRLA